MIQFNLLPDVKLQYIKARRMKRQVLTLSVVVAGACLGLVILLFLGVGVWQKHVMNSNKNDIKASIEELKETKDLDKILTVQNQLLGLSEIHDKKPVTSRLFTYLPQVTPNNLSISTFAVDYDQSTITMSGDADNIGTVNKFVDTLKFTTYKVEGEEGEQNAFKEVVLGSFGISGDNNKGKATSYQITLKFEPVIFDSTKNVTLVVPKKVTTRSETEKPNILFDTIPKPNQQEQ